MVTRTFFSTEHVAAAHLISLTNRRITTLLGFDDVWDERNGILMYKCLDDHYGSLELTFVPNVETHQIQLRVLYDDLLDQPLRPQVSRRTIGAEGKGNATYRDVHLRHLELPNMVFPYRRCFLRHAYDAYELMSNNAKPHEVGSSTMPSESDWEELFTQCASDSPNCTTSDWFSSHLQT